MKFVAFMEQLFREDLLGEVFANALTSKAAGEELFSIMNDSIELNAFMRLSLNECAMRSKEVFDALKKRGLLCWDLVAHQIQNTTHLEAFKWIEQNGIDVLKNDKHFKQFLAFARVEIMEYLMVEKGMPVEYMSNNVPAISYDILKMIYRVRGVEGIRKIDAKKIEYEFETVKFLRSIGYKFDEKIEYQTHHLNDSQKQKFGTHVKNRDIKACKHLYPFMKEIRKKKIMTMLLCLKKLYPLFQREIIWNILDLAYSPVKERGFL